MLRMAILLLALSSLLLASGCTYKPGSFAHPQHTFSGQRTTVGCLDIAVQRRHVSGAKAAVLAYQFGNRCDRPVVVDLLRVSVVGRTNAGSEIQLAPYDPDAELHAVRLDGRLTGGEAIAYPSAQRLHQICVDAASIVHEHPAIWLCFSRDASVDPVEQAPRKAPMGTPTAIETETSIEASVPTTTEPEVTS